MKKHDREYYKKLVNPYFKSASESKGNKKLTLIEQKKTLDFISNKIILWDNVTITWGGHPWYSLMQGRPFYGAEYSRIHKAWRLFIPKPTTIDNARICLHELGHLKMHELLEGNNHFSKNFSLTYAEYFADFYSFKILKYLGFSWDHKMWRYRKINAKCYDVKEALTYKYTNFDIVPLHLA